MAEEQTRGEQLFGRTEKTEPEPEKKKPFRERIAGSLRDMRDLITKPVAKGSKPEAGIRKPAVSAPVMFSAQKIDLRLVNHVLIYVLIGLVVMTVYVIFRRRPDISSVTAAVSKIKFSEGEFKEIAAFQEISFYLDQIKKRDIFSIFQEKKAVVQPVEPPKPAEPPEPPPPPKVTIQEKSRNLTIMGISWGERPKAIIKNEGSGEIYFLNQGERIEGTDIDVKEILRDSVILSSDGDEMTLL